MKAYFKDHQPEDNPKPRGTCPHPEAECQEVRRRMERAERVVFRLRVTTGLLREIGSEGCVEEADANTEALRAWVDAKGGG